MIAQRRISSPPAWPTADQRRRLDAGSAAAHPGPGGGVTVPGAGATGAPFSPGARPRPAPRPPLGVAASFSAAGAFSSGFATPPIAAHLDRRSERSRAFGAGHGAATVHLDERQEQLLLAVLQAGDELGEGGARRRA